MTKAVPHKWTFQARFRRAAFGWRGTALASKRITEALSEIGKAVRSDPILAAQGAVVLASRLSPALENIDSSSGAIGSAVNRAIPKLVRIIADAPADEPTRSAWLERLWEAFNDDLMSYIETLGDYWGELCVTPALASQWADRLLPIVRANFRQRGSYFGGTTPCLSALLKAERYGELLGLIEGAPHVWWTYRQWGFHALVAQGKRADALRYAEQSRDETGNSAAEIARACEELLLQSGMSEEAYRRYAIAALAYESTYIARFRSLAKKYPSIAPATLLADLVASTPGESGKWFAAAKSAALFDEAIALAAARPDRSQDPHPSRARPCRRPARDSRWKHHLRRCTGLGAATVSMSRRWTSSQRTTTVCAPRKALAGPRTFDRAPRRSSRPAIHSSATRFASGDAENSVARDDLIDPATVRADAPQAESRYNTSTLPLD